ncbi:MAG: MerR family DNA-binding protein [Acidovorax sp.]|nr:MerR family DNA-binding protein [Acidovorax sp.]
MAQRSGLAASRIRFYEKSGLLHGVERRDNGYREYGDQAVRMLEIISSAQAAGFTLDEIKSLLPDAQASWQHGALLESLQRKVQEIERLQERLASNKAQLLVVMESLQHRPADLACEDRPQWVLEQLRAQRG